METNNFRYIIQMWKLVQEDMKIKKFKYRG